MCGNPDALAGLDNTYNIMEVIPTDDVHESYCILDDAIKYGIPQGNTHYNCTIRVGVNNEILLKSCRFRKLFPTEITTTKDLRCKYGDVSFVPAADFRH